MEHTGVRPPTVIDRYPLAVTSRQTIMPPVGAMLLSLHREGAQLYLWALVNPTAPIASRTILLVGLGDDVATAADYIGSVAEEERVVWHAFEERSYVG